MNDGERLKHEERPFQAGTLVLDMTEGEAGFCARLLADLGARVIKVEKSQGDRSRIVSGLDDGGLVSSVFAYHNTNKLGLCLDLDVPGERAILRNLIGRGATC